MKRNLPKWLLNCSDNKRKNIMRQNGSNNDGANDQKTELNTSIDGSTDQNTELNMLINQSDPARITVVPISNLLRPSQDEERIDSPQDSQTSDSNMNIPTKGQLVVKVEATDEIPFSTNPDRVSDQSGIVIKQEIKDEPADVDSSTSATSRTTETKVKTESTTTTRPSCNYGVKCFRRNADHRAQMAHPGDGDYRRPDFPQAPPGTPLCPWGAACYRRNPQHFNQLSHPPATNSMPANVNPTNTTLPNRVSYQTTVDSNDDSDDYELEDPFINDDSEDEYVPGDEDTDEDDSQLES